MNPQCPGDSAISEEEKFNSSSEMKGKVSLPFQIGGDTSKKV